MGNELLICTICGAGSDLIWKERQNRIYRCRKCKTAFFRPVSKSSSRDIYGETYFKNWYLKYYTQRQNYFKRIFRLLETYIPDKGDLLDVGCGVGIFLSVAKKQGWNVTGQDTSSFAVNYCRRKGFKVFNEPLDSVPFAPGTFDLITLWDVIAHIENPSAYLKTCYKLLKPNGCLIIKTPYHCRFTFFLANIMSFTGKSRAFLHVPAQIYHFDSGNIKNAVKLAGFNVSKISLIDENLLKSQNRITISSFLKLSRIERSMIAVCRKNKTTWHKCHRYKNKKDKSPQTPLC